MKANRNKLELAMAKACMSAESGRDATPNA